MKLNPEQQRFFEDLKQTHAAIHEKVLEEGFFIMHLQADGARRALNSRYMAENRLVPLRKAGKVRTKPLDKLRHYDVPDAMAQLEAGHAINAERGDVSREDVVTPLVERWQTLKRGWPR